TILVFDGYRVPGNRGEQFDFHHVRVVFTKERESGDLYIERLIQEIGRKTDVSVVTSDGMIQVSALRSGVKRISSSEFYDDIEEASERISEIIERERSRSVPRIGDEQDLAEVRKKLEDGDEQSMDESGSKENSD
ncbi:MAG: NYN domain-containing protein, partial [Lachnospiraceae bacterium]|nr:NYN domain-containing protein [Lachnospiraceae bacterium]